VSEFEDSGRTHGSSAAAPDPWVSAGGWNGAPGIRVVGRPAFPWAGAILVVLGVAFLVHQLVPALDGWALVTFVLGAALCVAWLAGRSTLALWPGVMLLGYGVARLLLGLGVIAGDGWTTMGIGVGFAAGWLALQVRGHVGSWPLVLAALFVLVGAAELASELPALVGVDAYAGPIVVILLGLLLIATRWRRPPARG
jgi:hypothetical protein